MQHFRCKEHKNCNFDCCNNKYLAKNYQKFPKSARSQKKLDKPSPPLFSEIDANDKKKFPRTVRESTQSDNKLFIRQQQDQHNLYIRYRKLAAKLLYTSTTTSETYSLTPSIANGRAKSRSIFSEIDRANSEKFAIQQHDVQSANSYDNSLNENASEAPKLSFDATALQKCNHCNDIDLGDIDSTIPLTMPMEKRPIQITSIDGFFNRKRGRPPKNRFVEVYKNTNQSPQAVFTSFKLEKNATPNDSMTSMNDKRIFDYGGAFHNAVRMVTILPATINPRFAAISQLPIDTTTDSTAKLEAELDLQQKQEATATMNTAMRFMKGEIESLNKRHDRPSQHRNKGILNTNDLEYREGYYHIIPASLQRTQLKDNQAVSLPSIRDKPQDHGDTKSQTLKKFSVVRTVGTFFPECNEISGYPSDNKLHHENCFDAATTKPGIWSTQNVSCKRKRLQTDNKNMPYESIAKSLEGNEFILPQDLSMRIKEKNPTSTVCGHTETNVLTNDSSRMSKNYDAETAIEKKVITPGEAANTNAFDVELGWQNKEGIGLQLKHLFNLYQISNQQSFETYTQLQDQHSPVITSSSVTQADNNILPYLSYLLAASNKFQPRPLPPMQTPTTVPAIVTRQHNVSLGFDPASLSKTEIPTSTMTDGLTAITD
ncbi:uncharacterized protein LOC126766124 [Bactrocera neohumeralis]|uniref:uncharacterized protein LOC126766124 n=1 Tax=Bactrocera neohumeralis TaxID=98809 RepID=UPI0021669181|nr:uncharacterized protein LOC126766124 [Bactrocera neohumeralis]